MAFLLGTADSQRKDEHTPPGELCSHNSLTVAPVQEPLLLTVVWASEQCQMNTTGPNPRASHSLAWIWG